MTFRRCQLWWFLEWTLRSRKLRRRRKRKWTFKKWNKLWRSWRTKWKLIMNWKSRKHQKRKFELNLFMKKCLSMNFCNQFNFTKLSIFNRFMNNLIQTSLLKSKYKFNNLLRSFNQKLKKLKLKKLKLRKLKLKKETSFPASNATARKWTGRVVSARNAKALASWRTNTLLSS